MSRAQKKGENRDFFTFGSVCWCCVFAAAFSTWAHSNNKKKKNTSGASLVCVPVFRNNNGKTVFFSSHFSEPNLQYNENRKTNELVYMRTNETLKHTQRARKVKRKNNQQKKKQQNIHNIQRQ